MSDAQARAANVGGEVLCTGILRRRCLVLEKPVELPSGVTAKVSGQTVEVKGPKGTRSFTATDDVTLALEDNAVTVTPRGKSKRARQQWGMTRTMIANLVRA
jgi:large subunit ribosomal protein L6